MKMLARFAVVIAVAHFSFVLPQANAGVISIVGDPGDGNVDVNGLPQDFSSTQLRVGVGGNNVRGLAAIIFFALPNVPSSDSILGAELNIEYLGFARGSPGVFADPEFSVDLFGLGVRSTPTILSGDYYDGDAALSTDTLIVDGLITPMADPGSLQTSGSSLLDFVTSLYEPDGTPTAAYAVFRVNPDVHLPPFSGRLRGYELASADNANDSFRPRLNLTVIPEPSTLTLFALGTLGMLGYRWRRRKRATTRSCHTATCRRWSFCAVVRLRSGSHPAPLVGPNLGRRERS